MHLGLGTGCSSVWKALPHFIWPGEYSLFSTQHSLSLPAGSFLSLPETIKSQLPMGLHSHHLGVCVSLHLRCDSPDATGCHFRLLILHVHLHIQLGHWKCWSLLFQFLGSSSLSFVCPSSLCLYSKYNAYYTMLLLLLSHFSRVRLLATPWTAAYQAPPSLGFSRQEYWNGLPFPRYL